jgi:hypothetical protein
MNLIKCKPEVLEQDYHITIGSNRILSDGDVIIHFETQDPLWTVMKDDKRITYWTIDALRSYIEFVIGDGNKEE